MPVQIGIGTFFGGVSTGVGGAVGLLGQFGSVSLGIQALTGKNIKDLVGEGGKGIQAALQRVRKLGATGGTDTTVQQ